jgi:hypothetical protein
MSGENSGYLASSPSNSGDSCLETRQRSIFTCDKRYVFAPLCASKMSLYARVKRWPLTALKILFYGL